MERQYIAYILILIVLGGAAFAIAYARHNSHERRHSRRRVREEAAHKKRMADRADS